MSHISCSSFPPHDSDTASYYVVAQPSIDRHLFSSPIPDSAYMTDYTPSRKALTDDSTGGYHEVSFSPGGRYYVLQYKGPDVPWQKVIDTGVEGKSSDTHDFMLIAQILLSSWKGMRA